MSFGLITVRPSQREFILSQKVESQVMSMLSGKGSQITIIWLSDCFRGEVYWDGRVIVYVKVRNKVVILNSKLTGSAV